MEYVNKLWTNMRDRFPRIALCIVLTLMVFNAFDAPYPVRATYGIVVFCALIRALIYILPLKR